MNYHFMIDDKFFDGLIGDIEEVSASATNRYIIRGDKNQPLHVKHPKTEWINNLYGEEFREVLNTITTNDKVFIHWYDLHIGELMLTINKQVPLYVSIMGGDFYQDPFLYHRHWLFDKDTLHIINKKMIYPESWSKNPLVLLKQLKNIYGKKRLIQSQYEFKRETVKRIDYLLVGKYMDGEFELVKKLYNVSGIKHLPFIYDQNFDLAMTMQPHQKKTGRITVQVGNSATQTNNHLDLLKGLKNQAGEDISISLPLSYGDADYALIVKEAYSEAFGDKVEFLEHYMARKEYVEKLQEVDICIMYHNRSQALGNCITLLALGKKLYLKKHNPLWKLFHKIGVPVFDAETIGNMTYADFIKPLSPTEIKSNVEILLDTFSKKERLENLVRLVN